MDIGINQGTVRSREIYFRRGRDRAGYAGNNNDYKPLKRRNGVYNIEKKFH